MPSPANLTNPVTPEIIVGTIQSVTIDTDPNEFAIGLGGFVVVNDVQYLVPSSDTYPPGNNANFDNLIAVAQLAMNQHSKVALLVEVPFEGWPYITQIMVAEKHVPIHIPRNVGER
jgi:hypothetical protein